MDKSCRLSNVAKDYLTTFYCILDDMTDEMTGAKLVDSISYNFKVQMIPHHKAAIEMSQNILKYTTCIPLQEIANQIIDEQTKSIENMVNIQCFCESIYNSKQELCLYQRKINLIMNTMFMEMEHAAATNQVNRNFICEMIPHHKGAIRMAETTLQYNICPELIPILDAIITSQKQGIIKMQQILQWIGK